VVLTVESLDQLTRVVRTLAAAGQPMRVLGNGSNLLISDAGVRAWVIRLSGELHKVQQVGSDEFEVCAGARLMQLARQLSADGFSGLEFAAGIPASIGGAVAMNAGAHGAEIGERIVTMTGVLPDGALHTWRRDELPWRYRSAGLPAGVIVTSVRLKLPCGARDQISALCRKNLDHRRSTQPLSLPSAGSIFKNPQPSLPAGAVLDRVGMKGVRIGGALVSPLHANWIVNPDRRASAADVHALIHLCQERALKDAGVALEAEVRSWE